ncbi:hypothetical protein [Mycetohabitans rhizoxinica]|uniref:Intradiol ring-cleavage dioxygenases domain-containing protein n=1 Tax=Mycetohabitans rhizoxinica TaxID=412963 RepID=A0ABZ2PW84_9BURK
MRIIRVTTYHSTSRNRHSTWRRSIVAGANGRYSSRNIMLNGYAVSPGSLTEKWLGQLGRHLHLAHIHFFVSALGMRQLTVQTNIESDPYLRKDFVLATHGTC